MKTYARTVRGLLLVASFFAASVPALAQTNTVVTTTRSPVYRSTLQDQNPWQLSVQGGGLWRLKDKSRLRPGPAVIGRLTYNVTPFTAVGIEGGGLHFEDRVAGTKYGHLNGVPFMANVTFRMPMSDTVVPYIYAAAGGIYWSYDEAGVLDNAGIKVDNDLTFAAKPGAGVDFFLTPNLAFFVEGAYLFSQRVEADTNGASPVQGEINPNSIYGGGGFKIAF